MGGRSGGLSAHAAVSARPRRRSFLRERATGDVSTQRPGCPCALSAAFAAVVAIAAVFGAAFLGPSAAMANEGQLELQVVDKATGKPIACRLHLKTAQGKPRLIKKLTTWDDHVIVPQTVTLKLPVGNYTFEIERGPEYKRVSGYFTIDNFADDSKRIELERCVDMASEGWWSGDLDVRRSPKEIELLMDAEDLHVVPLTTWWNDHSEWTSTKPPEDPLVRFGESRFCQMLAGQQVRPGGTLTFANLTRPIRLGPPSAEYPPTLQYIAAARKQPDVWVDLTRPYWWDLPIFVAQGQIDSVQVAHGQMGRNKLLPDEPTGKPRDVKLYPPPRGSARWSQDLYFQLLNCGLKIPPSAGSGSGVTPNPVGYNRLYVQVDGELTYAKWWEGFRAGRVTITNGPLLRPRVNGHYPGHTFQIEKGQTAWFEIALTLSTRDKIDYLEIVKNGRVEHEFRFDEYAKSGRLPKIQFTESGWFLLRAVAEEGKTYRFAMTAPFYVEMGYGPRISKSSARFFEDWVTDRARRLSIENAEQRREILEEYRKARDFWKTLGEKANAE
jgi:hypothetical protein